MTTAERHSRTSLAGDAARSNEAGYQGVAADEPRESQTQIEAACRRGSRLNAGR
jgi:hypothetical protein